MQAGFRQRVEQALDAVRLYCPEERPATGLILGSGLGDFAQQSEGREIDFADISGFPRPTVEGHRGMLKLGAGAAILAGRFHYYEGHAPEDLVLPVFLLHALGVKTLVITNAAGGVRRSFRPGQLVLIRDHINLMGMNPLRGPNPAGYGPRFPDMSYAYPQELRDLARRASGAALEEGVYAAFPGPSYETPAEVRMAAALGADLVGMSTVPEVIAARYLGLEVLGISCVTNMAAGVLDQPLSHREVVEVGRQVQPALAALLSALLSLLADRR